MSSVFEVSARRAVSPSSAPPARPPAAASSSIEESMRIAFTVAAHACWAESACRPARKSQKPVERLRVDDGAAVGASPAPLEALVSAAPPSLAAKGDGSRAYMKASYCTAPRSSPASSSSKPSHPSASASASGPISGSWPTGTAAPMRRCAEAVRERRAAAAAYCAASAEPASTDLSDSPVPASDCTLGNGRSAALTPVTASAVQRRRRASLKGSAASTGCVPSTAVGSAAASMHLVQNAASVVCASTISPSCVSSRQKRQTGPRTLAASASARRERTSESTRACADSIRLRVGASIASPAARTEASALCTCSVAVSKSAPASATAALASASSSASSRSTSVRVPLSSARRACSERMAAAEGAENAEVVRVPSTSASSSAPIRTACAAAAAASGASARTPS
eukprot:scaffold330394_cov53-Tisochrysis_lutea.AAC.1